MHGLRDLLAAHWLLFFFFLTSHFSVVYRAIDNGYNSQCGAISEFVLLSDVA